MSLLPHWQLTWRILLNTVLIWLGLRFAAAGVSVRESGLIYGSAFVMVTVLFAVSEGRRRFRYMLIENLGVSGTVVGLVSMVSPMIGETILFLVMK